MTAANANSQFLTAQWLFPITTTPLENGFIAFEKGKITAVGRYADLPESTRERIAPPTPGSLLTPGLINTHLHLEQSFPQPIPKTADEPFTTWLLRVITINHAHASSKEKTARCEQGIDELLRTGTTCVNDIASGPESLQVLNQKGLRGIVSPEFFHPGWETVHIDGPTAAYKQLREAWAGHSRLKVGLAPHSPYNVSPAAWQAMLAECRPDWIHVHVSEFADEAKHLQGQPSVISDLHQRVLRRTFTPQKPANSPITYLNQFGLLESPMLVAHAVHTSKEDRELLARHTISVAHCPRSNIALHGQTLQAADWVDSDVTLSLGTDGRLSTETLDLRDEARFAMRLHGWPAAKALEMMTWNGAQALKMENEVGSLKAGKQADMVLWQADPEQSKAKSPEDIVLAQSTQARQVFIGGECRWQAGMA